MHFSVTRFNEATRGRELQVAEDSGVSLSAIQKIQRGKRVPGAETLARIAKACGLPVCFFFEEER